MHCDECQNFEEYPFGSYEPYCNHQNKKICCIEECKNGFLPYLDESEEEFVNYVKELLKDFKIDISFTLSYSGMYSSGHTLMTVQIFDDCSLNMFEEQIKQKNFKLHKFDIDIINLANDIISIEYREE